ncbi:EAL domain-containing protein [Limobrevibacterium gyesilva]|uniref:EAL domain-containing protein n=1 Tax=Limobrevibacterium gyesilva TaxID=2991712 RepID=A0AA42CH29_9PROT|nr:EAL domain-containing protein [Limobrevibacterium gyesilva]MCW3474557.1 EAL domain-containing protein [Limobrevibacterium gyesilva]
MQEGDADGTDLFPAAPDDRNGLVAVRTVQRYLSPRSQQVVVPTLSDVPPQELSPTALCDDLRRALKAADQLSLVYQPRIDLRTGRCIAAEALLRWRHPVLGPMNPGQFIPVVERDPLIGQLTDWVLDSAMTFAARLAADGHPVRISANVSPTNLTVGYFVGRLVELLRAHSLGAESLELEFTEGALIGDDRRTRQQLNQIRRIGISVAIDDFGAGFSNLGYLKDIPADVIKIDRSLVSGIDADHASGVIVRWLIGLAHELGLRVVAEGIETEAVLGQLTEWHCDEAQGYLVGRPMPAADLLARIEAPPAPSAAADEPLD